MENYLKLITNDMIKLHNIQSCSIITEKDLKPRLIIRYNDERLLNIDGDEEIIKYIQENFINDLS